MLKLILLFGVFAIAFAIDCTMVADGFYCNADLSYTWCVSGVGYPFDCAGGTGCLCGTDVECDPTCTPECESGSSDAETYCQNLITSFDGEQGYFCNEDGTGFYQCVRDAYCPDQASPTSSFFTCPYGAACSCDVSTECSVGASISPCTALSGTNVSSCLGIAWDCIDFTHGDVITTCDGSCPDLSQGLCFWDADSNDGVCAENFNCNVANCVTDSDCGAGEACIINNCCADGAHCTKLCP